MKVTLKVNKQFFEENNEAVKQSMIKTADAIKGDIVDSQTMPFDTGELQNRGTFIKKVIGSYLQVSIVSDKPYARRLYYHPEFNFKKDENPNAGGLWFEPYLTGNKKDYARKMFTSFLRKEKK